MACERTVHILQVITDRIQQLTSKPVPTGEEWERAVACPDAITPPEAEVFETELLLQKLLREAHWEIYRVRVNKSAAIIQQLALPASHEEVGLYHGS